MGSRGSSRGQRDQTDRTSTADYDTAAEAQAGSLDTVHHDRERLKKGTLGESDVVRDLVQPLGWVNFVSLNCTGIGIDAGELDILA
jgi:hypothetical protein